LPTAGVVSGMPLWTTATVVGSFDYNEMSMDYDAGEISRFATRTTSIAEDLCGHLSAAGRHVSNPKPSENTFCIPTPYSAQDYLPHFQFLLTAKNSGQNCPLHPKILQS